MILNEYRIDAVRTLLLDINSVTIGTRSSDRYVLADVYEMTIAAESFFPKKPLSLRSTVPANLRQKIDAGCPACANPKEMDARIQNAKRALIEYKRKLEEWLKEREVEFDENGEPKRPSVHELRPNINVKK